MRKNGLAKGMAVLLMTSVLTAFAGGGGQIQTQAAGEKLLTLNMAKKSGLANSPAYEKLESQLQVKEVSLKQAVICRKPMSFSLSRFRFRQRLIW